MITDREWEIIRVCLKNAPTPYDVGKYRLEVEELQKKIGMGGDTILIHPAKTIKSTLHA